jgi:histidinol-phosphate aminotransferase
MQPEASLPQPPDYIKTLHPYVPGKPIEETQREFKLKKVVKLASNENPLGPSRRALAQARKVMGEQHRYPDAAAWSLRQALSKHLSTGSLKISPDELLLGNGSNEVIDLLIRAYLKPGEAIATSRAAFVAYRICAQAHGVETLEAALTPDLRFDLNELARVVKGDPRVRMVFIANPNNPTGTYNTEAELRSFLDQVSQIQGRPVIVVLDYAYWEYVTARDLPDALKLQKEFANVVVLRTFSKIYGLAGFRVGYGVGSRELFSYCERIRMPFNLSAPALAAAEAALLDRAHVRQAAQANRKGMQFWQKTLKRLGIPFWPSQGNFLLVDVQKGLKMSGPEVFQACLREGVIFRPVANYGLEGALRISIGTDAENRFAARVLEKLSKEKLSKKQVLRG